MKDVTFRRYNALPGISPDYELVHAFLAARGYCEFTYARWDAMISHPALTGAGEMLSRIGLWQQQNRLVGAALFDGRPGRAYLLTLPGFEELRAEQLDYAETHIAENGGFGVFVPAGDAAFEALCAARGYLKTSLQETDLQLDPERFGTAYTLPVGYTVTDLKYTPDYAEYGRVLWKGFNHEANGEGSFEQAGYSGETFRPTIERPHVDPTLKVLIEREDGSFAAFCGMWYDSAADFAVVLPVATIPECRGLGLGRAAVLEGIRRARVAGAKKIVVGSTQQFYGALGFTPFAGADLWAKPE